MIKNKTISAIAFTCLAQAAFIGATQAGPSTGFYLGADAGLNWTPELESNDPAWVGASSWDLHRTQFDRGMAFAVRGGYGLGNGLRAEVEVSRRTNDVKRFGPADYYSTDPWSYWEAYKGGGDLTTTSGMLNVLYDVDAGGNFNPYIGVGAGMAKVEAGRIRHAIPDTDCCTGIISGDDKVLALQLILGAAYQITDNVALTADYRYFVPRNPKLDWASACDGDGTGCSNSGTEELDISSHSVNVGIRVAIE